VRQTVRILTPALVERAAQVFERDNAPTRGTTRRSRSSCPRASPVRTAAASFERERDILDVWFDSGSSHEAVLAGIRRSSGTWPADMYLEGTDQHRGWFQSSLLVGLGTRGRGAVRGVLTHGFVVDEHGRKMSKSLGNVVAPQQIIKESGADVLRLWVAMVDYREEIRLGKEVLSRVVEAYRKIRNTFRYLLSNLYDFDPAPTRGRATTRSRGSIGIVLSTIRGRAGRKIVDPRVRRYDFPDGLPCAQLVRDGRPERLLPRRLEGSAVHASAPGRTRTAVGADGDVPHGRRAGATASRPCCPFTAEESGRHPPWRARSLRAPGALSGGGRRSRGDDADLDADDWRRLMATPRAGERRARGSRGSRRLIGNALVGARHDHGAAERRPSCSSAIATSCRCCSSCLDVDAGGRRGRRGPRSRARPGRSASAAEKARRAVKLRSMLALRGRA
jgi:hypothetical protein